MTGIVSYGAYIPIYRLSREEIGRVWGTGGGKGEKVVANCDEDSLTMGAEAAIDCLQGIDRKTVDGLYFASTTPPYKEKQSASIIRAVLDLSADITTADFTDSLRAGTSALRAAMDAVKAGSAEKVLVITSDCRLPAPDSEFENLFGDGAAAFLIGNSEVALSVEGSNTTSSEFIDVWRGQDDPYPRTWEDRFVVTGGYLEVMEKTMLTAMKKYNLSAKDFARAVFPGPDARNHNALARKLRFDYQNQVQDPMFIRMGNTGAAFGLMLLAAAIEETKPGEKILFSNYGDGCDCYIFQVTDHVEKLRGRRGIKKNLSSKMYLSSYGKYLHFRNLMEWEPDRRPSEYSSLTTLWRDRRQVLALIGHKCKKCGKVQIDFPVQRVCAWCQSKDQFDEVRLSDKNGILFSFSMDERTRDLDLPSVTAVVDIGEGARFITVMTDRDPQTLKVGMPIEFTFRKIHEGQGICNYFWKCRPVRT